MLLKRILVFVVSLSLSGCGLTSDYVSNEPAYPEVVRSFYLMTDQDVLLVTGKKYGYLFEIEPEVRQVIELSRQIDFKPRLYEFSIDRDNNVHGMFRPIADITAGSKQVLADNDLDTLLSLGFHKERKGDFTRVYRDFEMHGKRYRLDGNWPFTELEHPIHISVKTPNGTIEKAGRIALAPAVAVAAAVYFMVAIPIFLISTRNINMIH